MRPTLALASCTQPNQMVTTTSLSLLNSQHPSTISRLSNLSLFGLFIFVSKSKSPEIRGIDSLQALFTLCVQGWRQRSRLCRAFRVHVEEKESRNASSQFISGRICIARTGQGTINSVKVERTSEGHLGHTAILPLSLQAVS